MGHCYEMAKGSNTTFVLDSASMPILKGAVDYANMGLIPKGCYDNKKFVGNNYKLENEVDEALLNVMFNPETSGGLLITVPENEVDDILEDIHCPNEIENKEIIIQLEDPTENDIINILLKNPCTSDIISDQLGIAVEDINATLTKLEMKGYVSEEMGGIFYPIVRKE